MTLLVDTVLLTAQVIEWCCTVMQEHPLRVVKSPTSTLPAVGTEKCNQKVNFIREYQFFASVLHCWRTEESFPGEGDAKCYALDNSQFVLKSQLSAKIKFSTHNCMGAQGSSKEG